jgi:MFS family permease
MSFRYLLQSRSFYPLFWTQFLGAFNDNLLKNALVVIVSIQSLTVFGFPAEQTVAIAGGIFILPFFLFSAIAGQLSDKYDKSTVLRTTKILEIVIMIFSAAALFLNNYEFLMITLFFMGLQSTFFGPAKFSILPQHISDDKIVAANALIEMGTFLAILLGTIFGGFLITLNKGHWLVGGLLLFVAFLGYLSSCLIPKAAAANPSLPIPWNPISSTWTQFLYALHDKKIFISILAGSWFWFVGAFVLSALPVLCTKHFLSDEKLITFFLTVFSLGIGLGSLLCEKLSHRKLNMKIVVWGGVGMSLSLFALSFSLLIPLHTTKGVFELLFTLQGSSVTFALFSLSLTSGLYIVPLNAFIQEKSNVKFRSQVIASYNINNALFMVISSIFLTVLFKSQVTLFFIFLSLAILNVGFLYFIFSKRQLLLKS